MLPKYDEYINNFPEPPEPTKKEELWDEIEVELANRGIKDNDIKLIHMLFTGNIEVYADNTVEYFFESTTEDGITFEDGSTVLDVYIETISDISFEKGFGYLDDELIKKAIDAGYFAKWWVEGIHAEKAFRRILLIDAYEKGIYESLNKLEFNYLIALLSQQNTSKASKEVGLSENYGFIIFNKLAKLNLIFIIPEHLSFGYYPELKKAVLNFKKSKKLKSVFGSPKAFALYKILKKEHLFVFPEIPLCAFIERVTIEHLFTEKWHQYYFLSCRVEFLVCYKNGIPRFAVEYHGGYHESQEQQEKDNFKKRILNEVGLNLVEVTKNELTTSD